MPHDVAEGRPPAVVRPAANNTVMWPGGSIYSSALELSRFAVAFLDGGRLDGKQVLPAEAVADVAARRVDLPGSDGAAFYGFGLIGYTDRGVKILQHGGFSRGYGSMVTFAPEHRFAVIVLTNRSGSTLPRAVEAAAEMFLPFAKAEEPAAAAAPLSPAELAAYPGVYEHAPSRWEVVARDGALFLRSEGKERELVRVSGARFAAGEGEEVVFVPGAGGRAEHIFLGLYSARRVAGGAP
jgi:hypothetical protein